MRQVLAAARYQVALLARSQRWLPPLVLLGAVLVTATEGSPPAADAFGFAAAGLLPSVAWLTRTALAVEPGPARAVLSAAVGTGRAQVSALLSALLAALLFALVGTGVVAALVLASGARGADRAQLAPSDLAEVIGAGLVAQLVSAGVGLAIGALCSPPVLRPPALAVLTAGCAVVLGLVAPASPAVHALHGLTGPRPAVGWLPLLGACLLVLAAAAGSVVAARRRAPS